MAQRQSQAMKNANVVLQRELDIAFDEIARMNAAIVAQEQKLAAHNAVAELEQKLHIARRATHHDAKHQ